MPRLLSPSSSLLLFVINTRIVVNKMNKQTALVVVCGTHYKSLSLEYFVEGERRKEREKEKENDSSSRRCTYKRVAFSVLSIDLGENKFPQIECRN